MKRKFNPVLFFASMLAPIALAFMGVAGNALINPKPARLQLEQRFGKVQAVERVENEVKQARNISDSGIEMIKRFEGLKLKAYKCPAEKRTIGYGHQIREGENYAEITEEDAERLLREDVRRAEEVIRKYVKVNLTPNQRSALISFVYNIGEGKFRNSTLLIKLNSGDYSGAGNEFSRWVYGGKGTKNGIDDDGDGLVDEPGEKLRLWGLEIRREAEREMFLGGK